jgi:ATP-dependent protease Clp ATPase subunit
LKIITQNKLRLKGEIKRKNLYKRVKQKNQKNKDQIEKHNILQIGIEWLH